MATFAKFGVPVVGKSVKRTTNDLSGQGAKIATTQKEIEKEKARQKKENERKKKAVNNRHAQSSKGRSERTKAIESKQKSDTFNHMTDMGEENSSTVNMSTCGRRGHSKIRTAIRRLVGKKE